METSPKRFYCTKLDLNSYIHYSSVKTYHPYQFRENKLGCSFVVVCTHDFNMPISTKTNFSLHQCLQVMQYDYKNRVFLTCP